MSAIEKIIAQMDQEAQEERASFEKMERARIEEDYKKSKERVLSENQKQREKQLEQLEKKHRQQQNRQKVESRQALLNEKQNFLQKLFEEAVEEMANWDQQTFQTFATQLFKGMDLTGEILVTPGEKSQQFFTKTWLAELEATLPYKLVMQETSSKDEAGFLLEDQGIQYNFLFSNLVRDSQETLNYELAQELFD
ncbi:MAG: ATPase V [Enterococcus sp.]